MPPLSSLESDAQLRALAARRWRIALTLTAVMIAIYFGFIALIAYDRPLLATLVAPGLTLGILLGALVIVVSWLLTYGYVRWANTRYDPALRALDSSTPNAGAVR
ncbi:MAG TPA: DUF485 domain-containing protein [Gemmatimonadaceae bacterium]|nr:DUF485 domain-containing protein [Gemmatimonadaceae bacterium]